MARDHCAVCGIPVIGVGGRENVWVFEGATPAGLTLDLADDPSRVVCFDCLGALPDEPTLADIERLAEERDRTG